MFKNRHNHPTEIEPRLEQLPIGGAVARPHCPVVHTFTKSCVSQVLVILAPIAETRAGKLPQQVISKTAAHGYSSYDSKLVLQQLMSVNTSRPGFVAKRMELGAVVGAAPQENVVREKPEAGVVTILLGGKTGRDGVGGARQALLKVQTVESVETAGAEVQKRNAIEERKIQRLFPWPV